MKISTIKFRRNRKKLINLLIKFKDNQDKYETYYKQLQELYYRYKINKYHDIFLVNTMLSNYVHSFKIRTLQDIKKLNENKKQLKQNIIDNTQDIDDIIEKIQVIFTVLEANKIVVEELQDELKFIKNIKNGIAAKKRSQVIVQKLKK